VLWCIDGGLEGGWGAWMVVRWVVGTGGAVVDVGRSCPLGMVLAAAVALLAL